MIMRNRSDCLALTLFLQLTLVCLQYRSSREDLLQKSLALLEKDKLGGLAFLTKPPALGTTGQSDSFRNTPLRLDLPIRQQNFQCSPRLSGQELNIAQVITNA